MRLIATSLPGTWLIEPDLMSDERGFFARLHCDFEFRSLGLASSFVQTSVSFNRSKGTLRGMHFQAAPYQETKIVRCTRGAIFDVVIDLRRDSPTYRQWHAVELSAENRHSLYIPAGCAHGFQTTEDCSEVMYQIDTPYAVDSARGVRWDDPAFGIRWPDCGARIISRRDAAFQDFED